MKNGTDKTHGRDSEFCVIKLWEHPHCRDVFGPFEESKQVDLKALHLCLVHFRCTGSSGAQPLFHGVPVLGFVGNVEFVC